VPRIPLRIAPIACAAPAVRRCKRRILETENKILDKENIGGRH
jgi:hypothetical protein